MRALVKTLLVPLLTLGWWVLMPAGPAGAASITVGCQAAGFLSGATFTLTADCDTTESLTVPDGVTLDGAGHTITAHDPPVEAFKGAVVTNAGTSMHLVNLTVLGTGFATSCGGILTGVFFDDADGSVSNVTVSDITQHSGCILGIAMRINALNGVSHAVTVTNYVATGFQRSGLVASGLATVNVSGSTIGPPDALPPNTVAQNSVQYGVGGAGGTFSGNTVIARGFGNARSESTAMLLFGASNLTISNNTITGAGTDEGISVNSNSSNVTIDNNQIERTAPGSPEDPLGIGVSADTTSSATTTLVCNQFDGWITNVDGVTQAPCITTNANLPNGRIDSPYAVSLDAVALTLPVTWAVGGGALPPGLALGADGSITGHPTTVGTFAFTAIVTDNAGLTSSGEFTITVTAALPPPAPAIAGAKFTPLPPTRIVDTRTGLGGVSGPRQPGSTTTFSAAGVGGVPASGVRAVVVNVTATEPAAAGFIQVFPAGSSAPGVSSSVNVDHAGQTIANLVIIGVDAGGRFSVYNQSATQLVVDVFGYYTDVAESTSGRLVTIDPVRVLDSRKGLGTGSTSPIPAQGTVAVSMPEAVPADALAVVMTLTADHGLAPGYIQAIPTGGATSLGASSNINIDRAGETMADTVIVPLGANGTVTLLTQSGAHLVVDVVGYFTGDSAPSATTGLFVPIAPTRVRDTRVTGGVVGSGVTLEVPFRAEPQLASVPPSAVTGNITATNTTASGYVQLIPTGTTTAVGSTSTLNINGADRIVAANSMLSGVTGSITVHNQSATHLVYDVTGYFL